MSQDITTGMKSKTIIDEARPTEDTLSSRGGLSLVARFLRHGGWLEQIASNFAGLRKSRKGRPVAEVFKQVICFFFDGTRRHLVHFDHLKQDASHTAVIESKPQQMLSSHAVKRFFMAFRCHHLLKFRELLRRWLIAELYAGKPALIILGLERTLYASSLRRRLIDMAAKIVRHGERFTFGGDLCLRPALFLIDFAYELILSVRLSSRGG